MLLYSIMSFGDRSGNSYMKDELFLKDYKSLSQTLPAMKGLAIIMIVMYHLWGYTKGYLSISEIATLATRKGASSLGESLLNIVCLLGENGVHFFLIASGFGLTASWWRKFHSSDQNITQIPLIGFWQHRLLRLLPLYWLAHGLALLLLLIQPQWVPFGNEIWKQGTTNVIISLLASLTTLRNFLLPYFSFLNGAWWYVGLSIQLYLVFPFLIWLGKRFGWSILLVVGLVTSILYRALIVALPLGEKATNVLILGAFFPSRLFEFTFGMVLAISVLEPQKGWQNNNLQNLLFWSKSLLIDGRWIVLNTVILAIGLFCHWASFLGLIFMRIPSNVLIGVGEFCLIFQLMSRVGRAKRWLQIPGKYSYGIYLTHMNIFVGIWYGLTNVINSYWLRFSVVLVITCGCGILFEYAYQSIEKTWLSFQRK